MNCKCEHWEFCKVCKPEFFNGDGTVKDFKNIASKHPDDVAVDQFAINMREKLARAREKGKSGWQSCSAEFLQTELVKHLEKGDPIDVANFAMMLWNNGEKTARPAKVSGGITTKELLDFMCLLSALESWALANGNGLPDYLSMQLAETLETLEREILRGKDGL